MNIGIVDSGSFFGHMREHGSLDTNYTIGDRFFSVVAQGGDTGPTPGCYDQAFNDSHGTHVSGTVAASRDGVGETQPTGPVANMHGVAFNTDVYIGNTAKTDGVLYGKLPATATAAQTPDNAYIGNVYRAVNAAATGDGKPIRLITSSWGSQPNTENYNTYDTPAGGPASFGLNASWRHLSTPDGVADADGKTSHWLNGAIDVARTGTIIQFTAGNGGYANPTPRGAAPYFMPELEGRWYTTSGINPGDRAHVQPPTGRSSSRASRRSTSAASPSGPASRRRPTTSTARRCRSSAACRSRATAARRAPRWPARTRRRALALIMQRFPYMTNEQALYTMFTTGRQNNTISDAAAVPNPTRGQIVQVPDARNGWHTVSLREAIKGPGQLLGPIDVDTHGLHRRVVERHLRRRHPGAPAGGRRRGGGVAGDQDRQGLDERPAAGRERHRHVGLRHRHAPRGGAQRARVRGQPDRSAAKGRCSSPATTRGTARAPSAAASCRSSARTRARSTSPAGRSAAAAPWPATSTSPAACCSPVSRRDEAARITDVPVAAGNVLNVGGNVSIGSAGRLVATVRERHRLHEAAGRRRRGARRPTGPGCRGHRCPRAPR